MGNIWIMKEKIILFGSGKLFSERRDLIEEKNEVICILDNEVKDDSFVKICLPDELIHLPEVPIIIMSDYFTQMVLQVSRIIGIQECNKRIKIGRVCYPIETEEKILADG